MSGFLRIFRGGGESPKVTLRRYFDDHFKPLVAVSQELGPKTLGDYELVVCYWHRWIGDIPLEEITPGTIRDFRGHLEQLRGRRGNPYVSAWTVRKHMTNLRRLLVAASPPSYVGRYGQHGQSVIPTAPIIPTPKTPRRSPKPTYTVDEVRKMIAAASCRKCPRLFGARPEQWWRAIIVTACYTGLRRGTLLALQKSWVTLDRIAIPAEALKGQRADLSVALAAEAAAAISELRHVPGRLLFAWQTDPGNLNRHLREIYDHAGLDPKRWHAWHGFRRYVASELTRSVGLETAAQMLGHTHLATTRDHYASIESQLDASIQAQRIALERLPKLG